MILDNVRNYINDNMNINHLFSFKGSRNQVDKFEGRITNMYKFIFIITLNNSSIKSFSYSDVLMKNLKILD